MTTPETDAAAFPDFERGGDVVLAEFARKLERQRDELFLTAAEFAGDLAALRTAVRKMRDVKGRYHTQQATEELLALLPENR